MRVAPRERFKQTAHAKDWANMSVSATFVAASDCALLHFAETLTPAIDMTTAAANHYRLEGAKSLLRVLAGLSDIAEVPKREPIGQLDHTK